MHFPLPTDEYKKLIDLNSVTYTVRRQVDEEGKSVYGETVHSDDNIQRDIYVFSPNEVNVPTQFGERTQGDAEALTLPDTDLQTSDVIEHPNGDFEVEDADTYFQYGEGVYDYYVLQRVTSER